MLRSLTSWKRQDREEREKKTVFWHGSAMGSDPAQTHNVINVFINLRMHWTSC